MADDEQLSGLLSTLTSQLSDLSDALNPLLAAPIVQTASRLPILDAAKVNVLAAYSLHTLIFNILKLNGIDAHAHPVYQELARMRTYFQHIAGVENRTAGGVSTDQTTEQPRVRVNKEAAARFVRHGLAGNLNHQHKRFDDDDLDAETIQRRVDERQAAEAHQRPRHGKNEGEAVANHVPIKRKQSTRNGHDERRLALSLASEHSEDVRAKRTKSGPPQNLLHDFESQGAASRLSDEQIDVASESKGAKPPRQQQNHVSSDLNTRTAETSEDMDDYATMRAGTSKPSKPNNSMRHGTKRKINRCDSCHQERLPSSSSCPHKGPRAAADIMKDLVERGSKVGSGSSIDARYQ